MIKRFKFWSNYAEDILLISLVVVGALGLYLFTAYFIIAGFTFNELDRIRGIV